MSSFKPVSDDEYEGPPTPNDRLLYKYKQQSCKDFGPMPLGLGFRSSKSFITFVVCMAVFTDAFLYTLIIPILPDTLTKNAGVPPEDIQYWTSILLSAFGAANLVVSPLAGYMADRTSTRRIPLLYGLYALTIATVMYCFGHTPLILVISRALQGASAAVIWVVGLALLSDTMGASSTGGAMGWPGIGRFIGSLLGPSLGGIIYELAGHYAVFAMAFTVLFFDIVLRFAMIERKVAEQWIMFADSPKYGATDFGSSILESPLESPDTSREGLSRPKSRESSATITGKLSDINMPASQSLGVIPLLRSPRILAALCTYFTCSVVMTAVESVLSLYTMSLFHWTAAESGLIFVVISFSILADPYVGRLTDKHGCRGITVIGLILGVFVWLGLCLVTTNTTAAKVILSTLLFASGFSAAMMLVPNMVEISSAVETIGRAVIGAEADPAKVMGRAYSLLNMSWGLGSIVGPLWAGTVIEKWGWVVMCLTFVVWQVGAAGFAWLYAGEREVEKQADME